MKKYNLVVCGGTFDHFHKGHREFLRYALSIGKKLLIGLTSDGYVKTKNKELLENYKLRKQQLEKILYQENAINRFFIEPIDDIFIPKVWESLPTEAIIVSKNTVSGAEKINLRRIEQGKSPLKIEIYPLIKSSENGYISSSRIRNGEINREGKPYINPLWFRKKLLITEKLRRVLKKQDGYQTVTRQARMTSNPYLMTVGDITTKTFNKLGLEQDISVIDFKVARQIQFFNLKELGFSGKEKIIKIANPAGCLTHVLFKTVSQLFKLKNNVRTILLIDGEEDLCVLPLTLGAPLGSVIFYGQPGEGVVKVEVSEKSKEMAFDLVNQFRLIPSTTRGY